MTKCPTLSLECCCLLTNILKVVNNNLSVVDKRLTYLLEEKYGILFHNFSLFLFFLAPRSSILIQVIQKRTIFRTLTEKILLLLNRESKLFVICLFFLFFCCYTTANPRKIKRCF